MSNSIAIIMIMYIYYAENNSAAAKPKIKSKHYVYYAVFTAFLRLRGDFVSTHFFYKMQTFLGSF